MTNKDTGKSILHFIVVAALLLAAGCGTGNEQPPIILDEAGWTTVTVNTENINSLTRPLDTTLGTASSIGPRISIGHQNPAKIDDEQFKISVSITPNQNTNAPVNLTTLTIRARKKVFGKLREKDITDDVIRLLRKESCTDEGLCKSLSVERAIKLGYGRGEYMFSINISDQTGQNTVSAFTITKA